MTATLPELIAAAEQMTAATQATFGHLTAAQLNWKLSPEQWSIGQCFNHLLVAKEPYFQMIEQVLEGTKTRTFWEKLPWLPGFMGQQMIKAMQPDSGRKVKAPARFAPSQSAIDPQIVQLFLAQEQRWMQVISRTGSLDSTKIIITSPVAPVITYSLADAIQLMSVHERRHFQQAERVMQSQGFPA